MMRRTIFFLMMCTALVLRAQQSFKKTLYNKEYNLTLCIDLYEESIEVTSMEMFGPMNGYLSGDIYRLWVVTSAKVKSETQASVRLSNDLGSETQEALLTKENDSTYHLELQDGVVIKKVIKKKLVKIPKKLVFIEKNKD